MSRPEPPAAPTSSAPTRAVSHGGSTPEARGPDPDLIAVAVLACPAVAGLHGGRFGEVATYLPGRRVTGIQISPDEVSVHLVGRYPTPVPDIDRAVRAALAPHLAGLPLTITVEDYALPVSDPPTAPAPDLAPPPVTRSR